jgi:hypothetical protein
VAGLPVAALTAIGDTTFPTTNGTAEAMLPTAITNPPETHAHPANDEARNVLAANVCDANVFIMGYG